MLSLCDKSYCEYVIVSVRVEKRMRNRKIVMKMNLREQIEKALEMRKLEGLREKIVQYQNKCPMDFELYILRAYHQLLEGNAEEAYQIIMEAERRNPYNWEMNLVAREVCEKTYRYMEAMKYEYILELLERVFPELKRSERHLETLERCIIDESEAAIASGDRKQIIECNEKLQKMENGMTTFFGLYDQTYRAFNRIIGTYHEDTTGNKMYNAIYNDVGMEDVVTDGTEKIFDNHYATKLEILNITEEKWFEVGGDAEYLLPILTEARGECYKFVLQGGKEVLCESKKGQHFEYYRVPPHTAVMSESVLRIGNPIVLKQDPKKKKLVLNIFLDGLSQKVLDEEGLESVMPCTSRFFSKGIRCTNVYTAGEWTLPAIATYMTGLSSHHHMVIHNELTKPLPDNVTILTEYFKEQGYQTAKIDGEWRSTRSYGYGRGMDRMIYQNQYIGMRAEQVIPDVIEHMELMRETNQFIWACIGDLHDVADGFSLRASTQATIPLVCREKEDIGLTSVKQEYSENKRTAYIKQMKRVDDCLGVLYRYIEENYAEEEIVVSLFGDHGQGYLVGEEEHFLAEGRSKVGVMFRGGFPSGEVCDELMSTCDYLPIMCKLAGISLKKEEMIDGRLPEFFGGAEKREYVLTESIHPGDRYEAALISGEKKLYVTSEGTVQYDGRFRLGDCQIRLEDKNGNIGKDASCGAYFMEILRQQVGELLIYE